MSVPIVPAIIPNSAAAVRTYCEQLGFSLELHLDVVDGKFVPHMSWPYQESGDPVEVKQATDRFTLEVDLMVEKPLVAAQRWLEAGADMLVFHVETVALDCFKEFKSATHATMGISALNDTPQETLDAYAAIADYVQVMGIAQIGAQGAAFDDRALTRIDHLVRHFPRLLISVDGSVNEATIPALVAAGAKRLIVGSAIVKAADPAAAHFALSQKVA